MTTIQTTLTRYCLAFDLVFSHGSLFLKGLSVLLVSTLLCAPLATAAPAVALSKRVTTVTISMGDTLWEPFQSEDPESGELTGLWRDIIESLFVTELHWKVRYMRRPWQRAQNEVKQGNADLYISIPTKEREISTVPSALPICRLPLQLYTYAHHPRLEEIRQIDSVEDIKRLGLLLVSNIGNGRQKAEIEEKGVKTFWVKTDEQIVRTLALKRADAAIDVPPSMNILINQLHLNDQIVPTEVHFGTIDLYLMVGKKSPLSHRMDEINAALLRLTQSGTIQALYDAYL